MTTLIQAPVSAAANLKALLTKPDSRTLLLYIFQTGAKTRTGPASILILRGKIMGLIRPCMEFSNETFERIYFSTHTRYL